MKVFLSADMEGTCGLCSWPETERSTPFDYSPMQKQMSREVAAACRGALSAGAEEVLVKDAHDSALNIDPTMLPRSIRMNRSWSGDLLSMMSGLDQEKYDAVFFTGYHAWASCPGNALSHTMNGRNNLVRLNGVLCSEFLSALMQRNVTQTPFQLQIFMNSRCSSWKILKNRRALPS